MLKDKLSLEERNNAIDCLKQWSQKENDTQSLIYKTWYGFCYPFVQDVLGFHWIDYLVLSSIIKPKKEKVKKPKKAPIKKKVAAKKIPSKKKIVKKVSAKKSSKKKK